MVPGTRKDAVPTFEPAATIEDVVERLHRIVAEARACGTRHGWFACLYLRTTLRVCDGISHGRFEDAARMERFDVRFANRYFSARQARRTGGRVPDAWKLAFDREEEPHHLVLQHLLLGMNAHINFDLGIAACSTCPGPELDELEIDFFEINRILAEMIDEVQDDLAKVSPLLGWVDRLGGRVDERMVQGFLHRSRSAAWKRAKRMAPLQGEAREDAIRHDDRFTARLGRRICPPRNAQPWWLRKVRAQELSDVDRVYEALAIRT